MTLAHFQRTFTDVFGNVQPGLSVEVRRESDGALAALFSDAEGNAALSNPFTTDTSGYGNFYAADGRYRIRATSAGIDWRNFDLISQPGTSEAINQRTIYVGSVAELKQTGATKDGQQVSVTGIEGYGNFSVYWDESSTETPDGKDVFQVDGLSVGRWIRVPALRTSDNPDDYIFSSLMEGPDIIAKGAGGSPTESYREIGNVLFDPEAPASERYKFVYSAFSGEYSGNNVYVGWAKSADGKTWSNEGLLSITRSAEDPYLVKHEGTYFLYVEDKEAVPFTSIRLYTSADFVTWTDQGDVLDPVAGGWEEQDVSSPVVFIEDGTFYMLYEGRATDQGGAVGLATSTDGFSWTRGGSNPVITGVNSTFGYAGDVRWAESVVPDDIRKVDDVYVFTVHAFMENPVGSSEFLIGILTSRDLNSWDDRLRNPAGTLTDSTAMFLETSSGIDFLGVSTTGVMRQSKREYEGLYIALTKIAAQTGYVAGTFEVITYDTPTIGAEEWDNSNNEFTASVSGVYRISMLQGIQPVNAAGRQSINTIINGTQETLFSGDLSVDAALIQISGSRSVYLLRGDTVKFVAYCQQGTVNNELQGGYASIELLK